MMDGRGPGAPSVNAVRFYIFVKGLRFATYICRCVCPNIDLPLLLSLCILVAINIQPKYLSRELDNSNLFPCSLKIKRDKNHIVGG